MADDNPFLALQTRLVALLRQHEYFAALDESLILTEALGDLDFQVEQLIAKSEDFYVVITTAQGEDAPPPPAPLRLRETLVVSLCKSATSSVSLLSALHAAIQAIHGQPVSATAVRPIATRDTFACVGHAAIGSDPKVGAHNLRVAVPLVLPIPDRTFSNP